MKTIEHIDLKADFSKTYRWFMNNQSLERAKTFGLQFRNAKKAVRKEPVSKTFPIVKNQYFNKFPELSLIRYCALGDNTTYKIYNLPIEDKNVNHILSVLSSRDDGEKNAGIIGQRQSTRDKSEETKNA